MSSAVGNRKSSVQLVEKRPDLAAAQFQPVQINSTPASRAAQHLIPAILGALFLARFKALVADPVSELYTTFPAVGLLQIGYVFLCLPAAGSQSAKPVRKPRLGEKRRPGDGTGLNYVVAIFLSLLLTFLFTPFVHGIMILFGAPLLTHVMHTVMCAAHFSMLSMFPLFYVHGVNSAAWVEMAGFRAPLDETFGGLVGSVLGAWLGAVPIPLDWDREWQQWPITIVCGIYGGYMVGKLLGGMPLYGMRFGSTVVI